MTAGVNSQLRKGLSVSGYTHSDDGVLWETYIGEDVVVQCPPSDDEHLYFTDLVSRAAFLISHASEHDVQVPDVVEYSRDAPAYLLLKRIHGQNLSAFIKDASQTGKLKAIRSAGEVFGQIHATDGFGYGEPKAEQYTQTTHETWRGFAQEMVEQAVEFTANGPFEPVVNEIVSTFELEAVPEQPVSSLLHGDFSADNLLIDTEIQAWAIDFDNALYGDSRYDYVRARDRLTGADPRERIYAKLFESSTQSDAIVLDSPQKRQAFETGYSQTHELAMDTNLQKQYALMAMVKSAQDGEWIRQNREISTAEWVTGIEQWYRSRFE